MRSFGIVMIALIIASCETSDIKNTSAVISSDTSISETEISLSDSPSDSPRLVAPELMRCGGSRQPACLIVKVIDVHQGNSALAMYPNGDSILFDAGGTRSGTVQTTFQVEVDSMIKAGDFIDYLVLSHSDDDHTNLLNYSTRLIPEKLKAIHLSGTPADYNTIEGKRFFERIYPRGAPNNIADCNSGKSAAVTAHIFCYPGEFSGKNLIQPGFPYDASQHLFSYLLTVNAKTPSGSTPTSSNVNSLVSGLLYRNVRFLFMGDAEGVTTDFILANTPDALWDATDIYLMSHHGSVTKRSNALPWLKSIHPTWYVASSGLHHGWLHPAGDLIKAIITDPVLSRDLTRNYTKHFVFNSFDGPTYCYREMQDSILTTYTSGSVTYITDGFNYSTRISMNARNDLGVCPPFSA